TIESCPSSDLFIPAKPEKKSIRRTRKHVKEHNGGSTDSDDAIFSRIKERFRRKKHKGQTDQKESKGKTGRSNREEDGQAGKSLERSPGAEKSEEQTGHKPNHSKTMGNATKLHKEQLPSIRTSRTVDSLQHEKGLTQHNREKQRGLESDGKTRDGGTLKDFYKECVEMSVELNRSPNKHWFKAN
ncbi:hypothetical protein GOODEAATRI_029668, partial [Goodea atripinnis]